MTLKSSSRFVRNRWKVALPVLILLVGIGVAGVLIKKHNDQSVSTTTGIQTVAKRGVNSISYAPSTKSDNSANETRKSDPSTAAQTLDNGATTSSSTTSSSTITISNAHESGTNQIAASADVTGVTSGTCTFTATLSGEPTSTSSDSVELSSNGDYYVCGPNYINVSANGNWTVSVSLTNNGETLATNKWAANPVVVN